MKNMLDYGLLVLRVGVAGLMVPHGWSKLNKLIAGFAEGAEPVEFYDFLGIGAVPSLALAVVGELVAPLLIVVGWKTRWAAVPAAFLDVHLMCTDPGRWVEPFAKAGAGHVQFHVEVVPRPAALVERIRAHGMSAGIVLNPDTPVEACADAIPLVDTVMLMSVHPGYSGQRFIAEVLRKGPALRATMRPGQRLMIDGGVNGENAAACRAAGIDVLMSASAIFGAPDYAAAIAAIRG